MRSAKVTVRFVQALLMAVCIVALVAGGVVLGLRFDRQQSATALVGRLDRAFTVQSPKEPVGGPVDFRAAAQRVIPSVVSIDKYEEVYGFFRREPGVEQTATGSGVLISDDGYILTNNHVIENAAQVTVRLNDKRQFDAKVIGTDPYSDLGLLKISAPNLKPAEMGSSKGLEIGQWVIAVGSPLGYDNTLSVGVVSSLNRTLPSEGRSLLVNAIQTDAAINQGNSGGALADAQGRLVGINTAIASIGGGSIGIGFAIPIDRARRVVNDILKYGRARYGTLGVIVDSRPGLLQRERVRLQLEEMLGAKPPAHGILVREVVRRSVAETAGLQPFDLILKVNGKPMDDPIELAKFQLDSAPGEKATVEVWHKGATRSLTLTLDDRLTRTAEE
ncbi:MAG: trypsin-like peptidase domain-containing protein [Fimbriimonadaceae bacterium]|nr:trypsin-like peptidase domain-containing protein [Fimbriimonadaceae bacterium]